MSENTTWLVQATSSDNVPVWTRAFEAPDEKTAIERAIDFRDKDRIKLKAIGLQQYIGQVTWSAEKGGIMSDENEGPKECPFCLDSHPEVEQDGATPPMYFMMCLKCGATGPSSKTRRDARVNWNQRGVRLLT